LKARAHNEGPELPLGGLDVAEVSMPMNGKVIAINVEVGQAVAEDEELVIIEAMKMELPVVATQSGTVKEIKAKVGETFQVGDVLAVVA
jgi:acetyl-CoA carboxylase biotin carboxyl carrier protein